MSKHSPDGIKTTFEHRFNPIGTIIPQLRKRYSNAFQEFRFFTGINIIDVNLLSNCNLTKIILPNSIREIRQYAFSGNRLTELVIPSSCKRVEGSILEQNAVDCNIIFKSLVPPVFYNDILLNRYTRVKIVMYVPDEALETYRAIPNLSHRAQFIKPLSEYHS